jgi:hypothetical protein
MKGVKAMENPKKTKYDGAMDIQLAFIDIVILNTANRPSSKVGKAHIDFLAELDKE